MTLWPVVTGVMLEAKVGELGAVAEITSRVLTPGVVGAEIVTLWFLL
jgi:hypothetical protein